MSYLPSPTHQGGEISSATDGGSAADSDAATGSGGTTIGNQEVEAGGPSGVLVVSPLASNVVNGVPFQVRFNACWRVVFKRV